jgi:hypothetical protein
MRCSIILCLALTLALVAPAVGQQEQPKEIKERLIIENVRVGLPEGRSSDVGKFKTGAWSPVYVDLTIGPQDIPAGEADLVVETTDNDGLLNQFKQALPLLSKKQGARLTTYVRPGNFSSEIFVSVQINKREIAKTRIAPDSRSVVDNGGVLWLTLGSKLPGLRRALMVRQKQPELPGEPNALDDELVDSPFRQFAAIDQLEQMPTRWFGYQAVDVVVLTSSSENFINNLSADRSGRLDALTEWVRRGGRMIISAGHNQQLVDKLLKNMKSMNCTLDGTVTLPLLRGFQAVTAAGMARFPEAGSVEIAKIGRGAGVDLLDEKLSEPPDNPKGLPLAVQAGCGMGHVILIGCDLDAPPFTSWKGQGDFWRYLQERMEPRIGSIEEAFINMGQVRLSRRGMNDTSSELAAQLQNRLEKFGDITVISFGWVALFILIYILIVGPLDYLFLKKVVKRLELTWITFPAVVLVVSTAAYFTAYYLKGNDLKINKLDVVDIDLTPQVDPASPPPRVFGSTWFTLFSPRIQNYTIGVDPAESAWGGGNDGSASTLVGWMGRPDDSPGGTGRAGSGSLFRRTYEYAPNAAGLRDVPIQVWATKSFTASWMAPPGEPPFKAEIKHPPADPKTIIGTVTNNLPVDLIDVALLYKGSAYALDRLDAGVPKRLELTGQLSVTNWLGKGFAFVPHTPTASAGGDLNSWTSDLAFKALLFHDRLDARQGTTFQNTALRPLDQGWRLTRDRDEVVLIGRADPRGGDGPADKVSLDAGTPSRLWLRSLPGEGNRPKLEGTLTQRTFVRVYIPVQK